MKKRTLAALAPVATVAGIVQHEPLKVNAEPNQATE